MRRFESICRPLAFAALLRRRRERPAISPVDRVTRRATWSVLRHVHRPLMFALHVMQCTAIALSSPRAALARSSPDASAGVLRERSLVTTRLVERAVRLLHERHTRVLVGIAPSAPAPASGAVRAPRTVTMRHIEHQVMFPRVTQILVRTPSAPASRIEAAAPAQQLSAETRFEPRPRATTATANVAALLPTAELSRLTDHVIRQLDRRVLSYRERLGQA